MRTYATILCLLLTVPAYAVDTLQVRADTTSLWHTYKYEEPLFDGVEGLDGSIWFYTRRSAVRLHDGVWLAYTPEDGFLDGDVLALYGSSDGSLWFVGRHQGKSGIARYFEERWHIYTEDDGVIEGLARHQEGRIYNDSPMAESPDGSVWFGGYQDGAAAACRFVPEAGLTGSWKRYTKEDGLEGGMITHVYGASDSTMWFGSSTFTPDRSGALYRFDPTSTSAQAWTKYTETEGLSSTVIVGIAEWPDGVLWVGTLEGVSRLELAEALGQQKWMNKVDFLWADPHPQKVLTTEASVWFAYMPSLRAGVVQYDGESWENYREADGLAYVAVTGITQTEDGAIWFAARRGVGRFDGSRWMNFRRGMDGLPDSQIHWLWQSSNGTIWFRSGNGMVGTFAGDVADLASISGRVTNPDNQSPWPGFTVQLEDGRGNVRGTSRSGGDGSYEIAVLPGDYTISVRRAEGTQPRVVSVAARDTIGVDFAPTGLSFGSRVTAGKGKTVKAGGGSRQGMWQTYSVSDGLPNSVVKSILQDEEGNLWFGTEVGGACRYDGYAFTTLTKSDGLADNGVFSIIQDTDGEIWFSTDKGVSRYDGSSFTTLTTEDGLLHSRSLVYQSENGYFWFTYGVYGGGVSRYDSTSRSAEGSWVHFTTADGLGHNQVYRMVEDRHGSMWFSTERGVSRYDRGTFTTFTTADGLPSDRTRRVFEDREGNLWVGTAEGVSRYDGERFEALTKDDGLVDDGVRPIAQDGEGHLWFGTFRGISQYDGKEFASYIAKDGLPHNAIEAILADRDGNIWAGTLGGGVARYDGSRFKNFTAEGDSLAGYWFWSALEDRDGHLWFGTFEDGVIRYDGNAFTSFTQEDGLVNDTVRTMLQDRSGHIWFGHEGAGVTRYDGERFQKFRFDTVVTDQSGHAIFQDVRGSLWFSETHQVVRYDGQEFTTITPTEETPDDRVLSILIDREGNLWSGTSGRGATRYDGNSFRTFTTEDGLGGNLVYAMLEDRAGGLWFGHLARIIHKNTVALVQMVVSP